MKTNRLSSVLFLSLCCLGGLFASCSSEDHEDILSKWSWDREEPNPDIVSQGWVNVRSDFGVKTSYLDIYKLTKTDKGDSVIAFIAVADMSQAKFSVSSDIHWDDEAQGNGNDKVYTPSEFYAKDGQPLVVINGGLFFYDNSSKKTGFYYSQSSCYSGGNMLSPNQNYWSEDWTNFWYPTIGFFFQDKNKDFHATWTYYANDGKDYSYADCKAIDRSTPETSAPDATHPSKGTVLNDGTSVNGIGGVSVLIHEGRVRDTWKDELLDVGASSKQPRTAIGYIGANKKLVFFVCEGRQMTKGVKGLTTAEVASLLKAVGCTEALNLDGGGSSCMIVKGQQTIKPSDGHERKVLDACYIQ